MADTKSEPASLIVPSHGRGVIYAGRPKGHGELGVNLRERWKATGEKALDQIATLLESESFTPAQLVYLADVASRIALPQKVNVHVSESKIMDLLPAALSDALADLDDSTAMRVVERFLFNLQESLGQDKRSE